MSTSERVQVWAMRGLTAAEITHQTKLPRSTVKYHLKRFKETGSWNRREYPVRVKTLTPFAECIRKHLKLHPHASATELHELLSSKFQVMVSVRTVQRYLKSVGREAKLQHENSGEDSDTSTTDGTEELSVASSSDAGSIGSPHRLDYVSTSAINYSKDEDKLMRLQESAATSRANTLASPTTAPSAAFSMSPHLQVTANNAAYLAYNYGMLPNAYHMAVLAQTGQMSATSMPATFHPQNSAQRPSMPPTNLPQLLPGYMANMMYNTSAVSTMQGPGSRGKNSTSPSCAAPAPLWQPSSVPLLSTPTAAAQLPPHMMPPYNPYSIPLATDPRYAPTQAAATSAALAVSPSSAAESQTSPNSPGAAGSAPPSGRPDPKLEALLFAALVCD